MGDTSFSGGVGSSQQGYDFMYLIWHPGEYVAVCLGAKQQCSVTVFFTASLVNCKVLPAKSHLWQNIHVMCSFVSLFHYLHLPCSLSCSLVEIKHEKHLKANRSEEVTVEFENDLPILINSFSCQGEKKCRLIWTKVFFTVTMARP